MSQVDRSIVDTIEEVEMATTDPEDVWMDGAGKAYQAVAAAAALAIQDAVDALRHANVVATSASGIALAQYLASGDPRYLDALGPIQAMVGKATENFAAVGAAAASIVADFPPGS